MECSSSLEPRISIILLMCLSLIHQGHSLRLGVEEPREAEEHEDDSSPSVPSVSVLSGDILKQADEGVRRMLGTWQENREAMDAHSPSVRRNFKDKNGNQVYSEFHLDDDITRNGAASGSYSEELRPALTEAATVKTGPSHRRFGSPFKNEKHEENPSENRHATRVNEVSCRRRRNYNKDQSSEKQNVNNMAPFALLHMDESRQKASKDNVDMYGKSERLRSTSRAHRWDLHERNEEKDGEDGGQDKEEEDWEDDAELRDAEQSGEHRAATIVTQPNSLASVLVDILRNPGIRRRSSAKESSTRQKKHKDEDEDADEDGDSDADENGDDDPEKEEDEEEGHTKNAKHADTRHADHAVSSRRRSAEPTHSHHRANSAKDTDDENEEEEGEEEGEEDSEADGDRETGQEKDKERGSKRSKKKQKDSLSQLTESEQSALESDDEDAKKAPEDEKSARSVRRRSTPEHEAHSRRRQRDEDAGDAKKKKKKKKKQDKDVDERNDREQNSASEGKDKSLLLKAAAEHKHADKTAKRNRDTKEERHHYRGGNHDDHHRGSQQDNKKTSKDEHSRRRHKESV